MNELSKICAQREAEFERTKDTRNKLRELLEKFVGEKL